MEHPHEALALAFADACMLHESGAGAVHQSFSRALEPASCRGSVYTTNRADLIDAELVDDLVAQQRLVAIFERLQCPSEGA